MSREHVAFRQLREDYKAYQADLEKWCQCFTCFAIDVYLDRHAMREWYRVNRRASYAQCRLEDYAVEIPEPHQVYEFAEPLHGRKWLRDQYGFMRMSFHDDHLSNIEEAYSTISSLYPE